MTEYNATLDRSLARLAPKLDADTYVFARARGVHSDVAWDSAPFATIREAGGTTLVMVERQGRTSAFEVLMRCRRLDPGVDTSLDAIGFLAAIATALARESIPVNPIAGADRDHLFVPVDRAEAARTVLEGVARDARQRLRQASEAHLEEVLAFWFGTLLEGVADAGTRGRWFAATPEFDREVIDRFAGTVADAAEGRFADWPDSPRGALAYVIVTDQFSRQVHRGTARAFATDGLALAAARATIATNQHHLLGFDERAFLYLPFEHSESLHDQDACVRLFSELREVTPEALRRYAEDYLRYARHHREIIERFGRFPHRNSALGRPSTPEEEQYLRSASGFGQSVSR